MRIDSSEKISETPILRVRELLRRGRNSMWGERFVRSTLGLDLEQAQQLINELAQREIIEYVKGIDGEYLYELTVKGNAFANATAAKPIMRKTADRAISQLLDRVKEVNNDPYFLYEVKRVVVFGSYLSNSEKINDVDIAIELVSKEQNLELREKHFTQRREEVARKGKYFGNIIEELAWPEIEVRKFLKSRSRSLSFHLIEDPILEQTEYKTIFSN